MVEQWGENLTFPTSLKGIASDELKNTFQYVVDLWLCSILSYIGIVDNIIAIMVFRKMGFQDTINISLTAIAFWDIVKGVSCAVVRMYGPIQLVSEAFAYTWYSYTWIIIGYINGIAGYVSGIIAAFVAVERCLCVALPFTVRFLLTSQVVTIVNIAISVGVVASNVVVYTMFTFVWVFNLKYNTTVAQYAYSSIHLKYPSINEYSSTISILYPFFTFAIMCSCTAIVVYHLEKASKVRSVTTSLQRKENPERLSIRDKQITKMLLVIIFAYIVSYTPRICFFITLLAVPEFWPTRRYGNMLLITTYIMFIFDAVNAAINPFILFFMSSQFRISLSGMFCSFKNKKLLTCKQDDTICKS